jgi:hypothetical protein
VSINQQESEKISFNQSDCLKTDLPVTTTWCQLSGINIEKTFLFVTVAAAN